MNSYEVPLSLVYTPIQAGAAMPEDVFSLLQNAAEFFRDDELAPYSPAWLQPMAAALRRQTRGRALAQAEADQLSGKVDELQACFVSAPVLAILRERTGRLGINFTKPKS